METVTVVCAVSGLGMLPKEVAYWVDTGSGKQAAKKLAYIDSSSALLRKIGLKGQSTALLLSCRTCQSNIQMAANQREWFEQLRKWLIQKLEAVPCTSNTESCSIYRTNQQGFTSSIPSFFRPSFTAAVSKLRSAAILDRQVSTIDIDPQGHVCYMHGNCRLFSACLIPRCRWSSRILQ